MTPGIRHHVLHATHGWRRSPRKKPRHYRLLWFTVGLLIGYVQGKLI